MWCDMHPNVEKVAGSRAACEPSLGTGSTSESGALDYRRCMRFLYTFCFWYKGENPTKLRAQVARNCNNPTKLPNPKQAQVMWRAQKLLGPRSLQERLLVAD